MSSNLINNLARYGEKIYIALGGRGMKGGTSFRNSTIPRSQLSAAVKTLSKIKRGPKKRKGTRSKKRRQKRRR